MQKLLPLDETRQGQACRCNIPDDRKGQQGQVHSSKNSSAARVYHISDADLDGLRQADQDGNGTPVAGAMRDEVEVRRSPVLDESGLPVPPNAAVELLQIAAAAATGDDQVAMILALRLEAQQVLATLARAERALRARKEPAAAAEMARQPPPAVLEHVREGGRGTAERAHAERPVVQPEVRPYLGEVGLERGPEAPAGEEGGHLRARPGDRLDDLRGHTARRGKERRRRDCPVIPCFGDQPQPRYGALLDDGQALHDDGEKLLEVVGDDRRGSSGKERHAGFPDAPAFRCVPAERRQTPGGPARPRRDDLAVRGERLAERGAPPQKIGPLLAKIQSRERAPQAWIDISTTERRMKPPTRTSTAA